MDPGHAPVERNAWGARNWLPGRVAVGLVHVAVGVVDELAAGSLAVHHARVLHVPRHFECVVLLEPRLAWAGARNRERGSVRARDVRVTEPRRGHDQHAHVAVQRAAGRLRATCGVPDEQDTPGAGICQVAERLSLTVITVGGGVVKPPPTGWPAPTLPAAKTLDVDTIDAPATTAPPAIIFLSASRRSIARSLDHHDRTGVLASGHHDASSHAW